MTEENLSNPMTVVGLVNGMIGGIILVMPILALKTGTALVGPITIITGFFSYFSCLLLLRHLKNYKDLDEAVYHHFGRRKSFKNFYDITVVIGMSVLLILYFDLICKQWESMIQKSPLIPILNAIVLFPIVYIMKKFHLGATLLAYGILSIIAYCIFLFWMWVTAPKGDNHVVVADASFAELGAALAQGFAIQTFFIPILKQNPNRSNYSRLLIITYVIGTAVYTFIGYGGAFSLINREVPEGVNPETIEDYFEGKVWEVIVVEVIYLVHLYSAFPEFLLIAKKRFFGIMDWPTPTDVSFKEVVYVGITIFVSLIIKLTNISAEVLIELNGSIISFVFVYLTPIGLHVKCVYFPHKFPPKPSTDPIKSEHEANASAGQKDKNETNRQKEQEMKQIQTMSEDDNKMTSETVIGGSICKCETQFRSKSHQICEMVIMGVMAVVGVCIMVYTIVLVAKDNSE